MKAIIPCLCLLALASPAVRAADSGASPVKPLLVTVTKSSTPVTDVLTQLSTQSGVRILADSTVIDVIGEARIGAPTLNDALKTLAALDPGLTWNKLTFSANTTVPNAEDLAATVLALRKIKSDDISIVDGATGSTMTIDKGAANQTADTGKIVVYLVTNETVRAQQLADKENARYRQGGDAAVEHTMADLKSIASRFDQMTPDQQSEVMPIIWSQLRYITRNIPPEVLNRFEHTVPQD